MTKTLSRLAIFLLAAGLVIAVSYALKPSSDGLETAASIEKRAVRRPATPDSEQALRLAMDQIARGKPDYSKFSARVADGMRQGAAEIFQERVVRQGPLRSLTYRGKIEGQDLYRAIYQKGPVLWAIGLGKDGVIQNISPILYAPAPQDWIDQYSAILWDERSIRLAQQFGILLGAAILGRLVLRLRL